MLETLVATIGVMLSPMLTEGLVAPGGLVLSMVLGRIVNLSIIVVITVVTNIIRSLRWCRGDDGSVQSYGAEFGIKKGIVCGLAALGGAFVVSLIPVLRIPFTVISFIPGLGSLVDGIILAFFYLLSYLMVAHPIWGAC